MMRKLMTYLMFFALFTTLCIALFPTFLADLLGNGANGTGERTYVAAVIDPSGDVFAVEKRDNGEYRIQDAQTGDRTKLMGIPKSFALTDISRSLDGYTLFGGYVQNGVGLSAYELYAVNPVGVGALIISEETAGETADEQRNSVYVADMAATGDDITFAVVRGDVAERYVFSASNAQGVTSMGFEDVVTLDAADTLSASLALEMLLESGHNSAITYLAPATESGTVAIQNAQRITSLDADGISRDHTVELYRPSWVSILILGVIAFVILFLSYACYYAACEVHKVYVPLVLKQFIILTLVSYWAVTLLVNLYIEPTQSHNTRETVIDAMSADVSGSQIEEGTAQNIIADASRSWAGANADYMDNTWILFNEGGEIIATTDEKAQWIRAGENTGILSEVSNGDSGDAIYVKPEGMLYAAFNQQDDGNVLCMFMNAGMIEARIASDVSKTALGIYAALGIMLFIALMGFAVYTSGVRRITKGMDAIASGMHGVHVVENSRDEVLSLAMAFNDMSAKIEQTLGEAKQSRSEYFRFVPEKMLELLGANNIDEVSKDMTASHDMCMMVVHFHFPEEEYQNEAQSLFNGINRVFDYISSPVTQNGGTIYNFSYDGFDAVFEKNPEKAISAAVAAQQAMIGLNEERAGKGKGKIMLRIALDYGTATLGIVGTQSRVVPTVVSTHLSTARHLIDIADKVGANILCTAEVSQIAKDYSQRYIGKSRNVARLVRVFEMFDGDAYSIRQQKENMREEFSNGIFSIYSGEYTKAKEIFMDLARKRNEDGIVRHYLYLADRFEKQPPQEVVINV